MAIFGGQTDRKSWQAFQAMEAQAVEEARLHPIQKFTRTVAGGGDTITLLPGGMVAYRVFDERGLSYAGSVGDLNANCDTIIVSSQFRGEIKREEFSQFMNAQGRRLTDVFTIQ